MPDEKDLLVVSIDILGCQRITSWFEFVSCALEATARGSDRTKQIYFP
jgi:hypothetical protein